LLGCIVVAASLPPVTVWRGMIVLFSGLALFALRRLKNKTPPPR
jgi:hypothetical protein